MRGDLIFAPRGRSVLNVRSWAELEHEAEEQGAVAYVEYVDGGHETFIRIAGNWTGMPIKKEEERKTK